MKTKEVENLRKEVEAVYAKMNEFISRGELVLADLAYPEHDGKEDAEAVGSLMLLRQDVGALVHAGNICIDHISNVIDC